MAYQVGKGRYRGETYPEASRAGGAANVSPLSRALYVDPNSTVTGTRDGSIAHPFLTIQAAFDSKFVLGQDFECTFIIVPCFQGDSNAGNLSIPANGGQSTSIGIEGAAGTNRSLETPTESIGIGAHPIVGDITIGAGSQNTSINGSDVVVNGTISGTVDPGSNVNLSFDSSQISTVNVPNSNVLLTSASVDGDLTAGTIEAYSSTCLSPPPGQTWTADTIRIDASTNRQLHSNGVTLVGQVQVMDRPARAVLSVNVPALGANELQYVNVDVTGTELDGIVANDPVVVNPTSDLASAGANGGFLADWRVSGANTVRLAFKGTLAGGAANFTFSLN